MSLVFNSTLIIGGPLAQLVEQRPFKAWVEGSSPSRLTILIPKQKQVLESPSSSQAQDTGLSRRRRGFESRWGRHSFLCFCSGYPDFEIAHFLTGNVRSTPHISLPNVTSLLSLSRFYLITK